MLDIVFVVLNYNVVEITIDCINSIKKNIDTMNYRIILVDNASSNHSGEKLQQFFINDKHVIFVKSNKNIGFARGNNLGIELTKKEYPAKFVCCLNNDTLLQQKNFFEILSRKYETIHPAIIGPRIRLANGKYEPLMDQLRTVEEYRNMKNKLFHENAYWAMFRERLLQIHLIEFLNDCRHRIAGDFSSDYREFKKSFNEEKKDIVLHGCCLIFTPIFFSRFDGFNPNTFMYREEDIIFYLVKSQKMHTLYTPELNIVHLEKKSTAAINKNTINRIRFFRDNQIKSLQVLIDLMEADNNLSEQDV